MTEIRKANISDLAEIETCAVAAYTMYVERIGREPAPMVADFAASIGKSHLYVAQEDDKIVGFVVFYARQDHAHLENVAVTPGFQNRGIGRKLIGFVEQQAQQDGYNRIELYTNASMSENLELYPRLGYQQIDRRVEDGFDRVYFSKTLD
ncbi:MAG: GNAT family N-acetyltransferase [Gammaproteobacteria bacterium]|nr:GNAT family N-acetyltransferase [Gammaproteobacteria bacterium]